MPKVTQQRKRGPSFLVCPRQAGLRLSLHRGLGWPLCPSLADLGVLLCGSVEIKLGKNRTEAEVKRYTEEKERLEKKKEEIRGHLAQLRREKRELRETLLKCTGKGPPRWRGVGFPGEESGSAHRACGPVSLRRIGVWCGWVLPCQVLPPSCLKCCYSVQRPSDLPSTGPGGSGKKTGGRRKSLKTTYLGRHVFFSLKAHSVLGCPGGSVS